MSQTVAITTKGIPMKLTHFGHACVLVETDAGARILFDPGTYSQGFETLTGLDAIVLTHEHPDHVDDARLPALREANADASLIGDEAAIAASGTARSGDVVVDTAPIDVAGTRLTPTGYWHAVMHPDLPRSTNHGFVIDGKVWHPGDSLDAANQPDDHVDVLLLPLGGPWMKAADAIDFARAVAPRVIVPIHEAGLASVHQALHGALIRQLVPKAEFVVLEQGVSRRV